MTPPIIRQRQENKPTRFNIGVNLRQHEREALKRLMRKRGNHSWEPPTDEIEIEDRSSIVKIMRQKPEGSQAIVTKGGN